MKKIISAFIVLTVIFSIGSVSVNAAEPQLTIITQYGEPVEGIYIKIYLIASRNSDGTYSHEAPFADKLTGKNLVDIVSSAGDNVELTKELLKVVSSAANKGNKPTDTQGKAVFPISAEGLYLVMQDTAATGSVNNNKYIMQSFILPVPYLSNGGELEYDVTAKFDEKNLAQLVKPKLELITTEKETETTTAGESGSSGNNDTTTTTEGESDDDEEDDEDDENPPTNPSTTNAPPTDPGTNPSDPPQPPSNLPPSENPSQPMTQPWTQPQTQTPTEPTIEIPTAALIEDEEIPEDEEIFDDRIPLSNGWFAEYNEDEDLWYIYDENGIPLGVIFLPEGESIEDYDVEENIIPFDVLPFPEEPETIVIIKSNPITGDSILDLVGLVIVAGLCAYYVISKKKKNDATAK